MVSTVKTEKSVKAPTNVDEAAELIKEIRKLKRQRDKNYQKLNERIDKIREDTEEKNSAIQTQINMRLKCLEFFANTNRDELTNRGKSKTIKLRGGHKLFWRTSTFSLRLTDTVSVVVERLKALGQLDFVRVKEEVDVEKLRQHPQIVNEIQGIEIIPGGEHFYVQPAGVKAIKVNVRNNTSN